MPELPEVETVRRVIEPQIKGRKIVSIGIGNQQVIGYPDAKAFCTSVCGQTVAGMSRRGKFLCIFFEKNDRMVLHLRMTGCLLVTPPDYEKAKHTHAVFDLDDGSQLRYIDPRRFGRLWFLKWDEEDTITGIHRLGPEPFDAGLTGEYLQIRFSTRKKTIKECLLDQSLLAGIGNIYADEILFASGIFPGRTAKSLTAQECGRLADHIPRILTDFIEKNDISAEDYLSARGMEYRNAPYLQVYGRQKEPCPICGRPLEKMVLAGRSSVFCPSCQKKEPQL
ncbi:MAG: bifunctional DNA-formamidopyrimidine glycosylase/DNA-(apurinic or apyrimidinic site) lyase [Clostridiales Family XIII bacterium]|nr:bifunctional DNA-formamidopyrimidine glycosylase/DNA-(apurinic or apyrimidinic site) lyase [Clostridia bacterium]MDY3013396.1 bifunctional DNA-formamidopyrimidine glycosylase/DNA-(apurinic or apyrimidinic site) lyase [Clostridiales Family XIII bacterium]